MTTPTIPSADRPRLIAAASSVLAVVTVLAAVSALVIGWGAPRSAQPHTRLGLAAHAHPAAANACGLVVGPGRPYCERGTAASAAAQPDPAGAVWSLVPTGVGLAVLVALRLRAPAGKRGR
ncbi:hypothetical protein [Streptomyces sp. NPDC004286]|uniref:hypothetical protein n=1 Tax=Streptomyces sp. NPDC004286 TaxID=3364696 RepID=UPI0036B24DFE